MADNTFDPVAMGLLPIMVGQQGPSDSRDAEAGTQIGWMENIDSNTTHQWDLQGNDLGLVEGDGDNWVTSMSSVAKKLTPLFIAAVGAGAALGLGGAAGTGSAGSVAASDAVYAGAGGEFLPGAGEFLGESAWTATPGATALDFAPAAEAGATNGAFVGEGAWTPTNPGLINATTPAAGAIPVDAGSLAAQAGEVVTTGAGTIPVDAGSLAAQAGEKVTTGGFFSDLLGKDVGGVLDSAGKWLTSDLGKLFVGGLGNYWNAKNTKDIYDDKNQNNIDVANINAKSAIDQLKEKEAEKLAALQRRRDSILGSAPRGLINATPKPLTRLDGSPVFNNYGGLIHRGT